MILIATTLCAAALVMLSFAMRNEQSKELALVFMYARRVILLGLVCTATTFLTLGMVLPSVRLEQWGVWTHEYSLLSAIILLYGRAQWFLASVLFVFAIVLPGLKLFYTVLHATSPESMLTEGDSVLNVFEWIGRWSMQDVFALALIIFYVKTMGVQDAISMEGAQYFCASVVLSLTTYAFIPEHHHRHKDGKRSTIPSHGDGMYFFLFLLVLAGTVLLVLGVVLPVVQFTTVWVVDREYSIFGIATTLLQKGDYFLGGVLILFSIIFPSVKILYLATLLAVESRPAQTWRRSVAVMEWLGRYSMTDMMVLALMIFYMNMSGYTEAYVLPGTYFFSACAFVTMFAYILLHGTRGK